MKYIIEKLEKSNKHFDLREKIKRFQFSLQMPVHIVGAVLVFLCEDENVEMQFGKKWDFLITDPFISSLWPLA
jgi:hypothetical protein